jgi:hypothetical protein
LKGSRCHAHIKVIGQRNSNFPLVNKLPNRDLIINAIFL